LPGAGAVSTSRAGTGVASTEGAEAISLNPAGMAKSKGTTISLGFAIINYDLTFQRNGNYDDDPDFAYPYEGQRYGVVENTSKPPLGIGRYQPVPMLGITSDLGGAVPNLTLGFGLYTINAYPFRDMNNANGNPYYTVGSSGAYEFPAFGEPPPPSRYDIVYQEAAIILPSLAAAYRIGDIDIGGRFGLGFAHAKSAVGVWGGIANYNESIDRDGIITLDATDSLVPGWGLGLAYRPTPNIEIGAQYTGQTDALAKGEAKSANAPGVTLNGTPIIIQPVKDEFARCDTGGTAEALKGCVTIAIPMMATIGARYKFLDGNGATKGDLELDVDWQNWGADAVSNYKVVVDGEVTTAAAPENAIGLKDSFISHGFRDTWGVRLGGSWSIPQGDNAILVRGGIGYETGAAKPGWERLDVDGAARTMLTAGGSYKLSRVQIDAGFGVVLEGTRTDSRTCNPGIDPTTMQPTGCGPAGEVQPVEDRKGPDPTNPLLAPAAQSENPVNQGTFTSQYLLFMLGVSTWF